MTPEQAWQAALGQLQMEMPKATFDTWVRDARFLSFAREKSVSEGSAVSEDTFTIGFANVYARDWVASRLTSTIRRILTGILGHAVRLDFVVQDHTPRESCPEEAWDVVLNHLKTGAAGEEADRYLKGASFLAYYGNRFVIGLPTAEAHDWFAETGRSTCIHKLRELMQAPVDLQFVVSPLQAGEAPPAPTEADQKLSGELVELLYLSIRDEIIKPERVVVIPGYFKRWLPYLGPTLGWMIVAFRQILYLQSRGAFKTGYPFSAASAELCKWSGLSRATIARHKDAPMLGWFLTRIEQDHKWAIDSETGRPKQKSSSYQFIASMPMTPGDQDILYDRLMSTGFQEDPIASLEQLISLQPHAILPYPPPLPKPEQINRLPTPRSVQDIIRIACGKTKNPINSQINQLADKLADRLMPPTDNIVVTHYFLQNQVGDLGPGPAWMITLFRDNVYYKSETGELRDFVWISGGYQEIADRLGLNRHRTVSEWLPPVFERSRQNKGKDQDRRRRRTETRESVAQYLEVVDYQQNDQGNLSLKFKVNLSEPLTPVDQALYELAFKIFNAYLSTCAEQLLQKVTDWEIDYKDALETLIREIKDAFETLVDANDTTKDALETLAGEIKDAFETLVNAFETQTGVSKTRLRLLKHLINHLYRNHFQKNTSTTTTATDSKSESDRGVVVGDQWDLEKLLQIGGLAHDKIPAVLNKTSSSPGMALKLIAWCLYGYANKTNHDRQGIDAPVLFAVSRYIRAAPDPDYLALARKTPVQLVSMSDNFFNHRLTHSQQQILSSLQENGFIAVLKTIGAT